MTGFNKVNDHVTFLLEIGKEARKIAAYTGAWQRNCTAT